MRVGASGGGPRLAVVHERAGEESPAIWDLGDGTWTDLKTGLRGPVEIEATGGPMRRPCCSCTRSRGVITCTGSTSRRREATPIDHPPGHICGARCVRTARVWFRHSSGGRAARILDDRGDEVLAPEGRPSAHGARVRVVALRQSARPDGCMASTSRRKGTGPFPVLMHPHGGPTWLDEDRWSPEVQAYVDAGFAVAHGELPRLHGLRCASGATRWSATSAARVGGPQRRASPTWWPAASRIPAARPIGGWSWGGYLTLMELGKHPELWLAGVAGVPSGTTSCPTRTCPPTCRRTTARCWEVRRRTCPS